MLGSLLVYVTKETSVVCFIKESVCNVDESNILQQAIVLSYTNVKVVWTPKVNTVEVYYHMQYFFIIIIHFAITSQLSFQKSQDKGNLSLA